MSRFCCYVPNLGRYKIFKLKELSNTITKGTTAKQFTDSGINFIKIESIMSRKSLSSKKSYISKIEHENYLKRSILQQNDILFSIAGALGIVHIVQGKELPANTNQALSIIRLSNKNDTEYVAWFLETNKIKKIISELKSIGAQPNLSLEQVGNFNITYYEDKKSRDFLVRLMNSIEDRIETQNKIIDKLESLRVQIKERIFDLGSLKKTISDVLIESNKKSNVQDQYPVLSSTVKGLFLQSDYFDREVASSDNIGYKIVKKGQIIISPQNLWMGNLTYNDSFEHGIVSPSYKVFDIKEAYSKIYIYWLLTSKHSLFNYGLVSEQGASIVRRNLNYDSFLNITLPLCNEEQQKHISKLIKSIEAKLKIEKQRAELFAKQKNYLLSNLFI